MKLVLYTKIFIVEIYYWRIGDLGLLQHANNTTVDKFYGVIAYVAPEIFSKKSCSKKSDIYSLGIIMWEVTTGCRPFANVANGKHDIDFVLETSRGKRPKITDDTPKCFANLMERCWDHDPSKRPHALEICKTLGRWSSKSENFEQFNQAEKKRSALIGLNELGPNFTKELHPKAFTNKLNPNYIDTTNASKDPILDIIIFQFLKIIMKVT
ncbi:17786_t:CDS:2 [Funneliformis geosporum]|nr:17786_t:CDS:2 [Funneliformis geosporum]